MPNPGLGDHKVAEIQGRLLAGMKPSEICKELGVSASSVSRAKAKIGSDLLAKMDHDQAVVVADLVMQQLEVGLEASITIALQAQNDEWRNKQGAHELATFYGVVTDKSIRLLEASEAATIARQNSFDSIPTEGSAS